MSTGEFAEESAVELAGSEGEVCCHFYRWALIFFLVNMLFSISMK